MPLTPYQTELGRLLARNRSEDSYLAGGAALLLLPNTQRFSQDLDYFHDSTERVASAYEADRLTLVGHGYAVDPEITQPGYIRALVRRGSKDGREIWGDLWAEFTGKYGFTIVQRDAMKQDVSANVEVFQSDIRSTGHAAVYGITFDTDSASIKPESAQAIEE